MVSVQCSGCNKQFSKSGYTSHISRTKQPSCHAIYLRALQDAADESARATTATLDTTSDTDVEMLSQYGDTQRDFAMNGDDSGLDHDEQMVAHAGEEEEEMEADANAELECGYEPPRPLLHRAPVEDNKESANLPAPSPVIRKQIEDRFHGQPVVDRYPSSVAGKPIRRERGDTSEESYGRRLDVDGATDNPYAPFASKMDWEIAQWAKMRGSGSTAFTDLLKIDGVRESLGLSYGTSAQLNTIIDKQLPQAGRPVFERSEILVDGEVFDLYSRNILDCIRALYGDSNFAPHLLVLPERHYIDKDRTIRMYHNMNTGKWWWATQEAVEKENPGATIIPIIISSDKTQLTPFGNKTAYPVYLTIGNIPKEIRRKPSRQAYILLGYLPTSKMKHITNKASRRRVIANVFHAAMKYIVSPLSVAGKTGIEMASGDGVVRRGHPIFAAFVGDYPEQVLVTGVKTGECGTCEVEANQLGELASFPLRDLDAVLSALSLVDEEPAEFKKACTEAGIKPIYHPFWEDLPYTNIFRAITPDVLHQLYQGVVKHLINWVLACCGEDEIDARCRRLPPNHNMRLFMKGISGLSRVTGREHDQISRFLLGIIINIRLPNGLSSARLLSAVRGLLDFVYLAQYPMHTDETLGLMDDALQTFHENKQIFVDLGVRSNFNLPKLHSTTHYTAFIRLFGTTDNTNTEYTERLHIDLAKDAYRSTNFKDEFPQMTLWLERKEKVVQHAKFIQWKIDGCPAPPPLVKLHPGVIYERKLLMAKNPTIKAARIQTLVETYGATLFREALSQFVVRHSYPALTQHEITARARHYTLPFNQLPIFHRIKFTTPDPYTSANDINTIVDSVHVEPSRQGPSGPIPGRFDTVLVNDGTGGITGTQGYRIGQVRVIFSLPTNIVAALFPSGIKPPTHLAYIQWFSAFTSQPEPHHLMYKVQRVMKDGERLATIVPVASIRRSVQLLPKFGPVAPVEWSSSNVLERSASVDMVHAATV
ncbi:hypothetical protein MIND_01153100 [Mycena indigotica]|uniref:C2H2-type domain-containing protein n=1 Tax=Mycena indigotica TaxID=2126181 RepID=A0A8H6S4F2_9AGAR|nr:uncharacterized protein MIND_01153100 [Mycena indigotica]KAF7292558.1 hypothetical protein MIND_01153100 [Mycena indigotica]